VINVFNADNDILIWDFAGETRTRLALGRSGGDWPVWTPDGERIAYHPSIGPVIDWRSSNNIGSAERLASGGEGALDPFHPEVFSPSGAELVFHGRATSASGNDIGVVTLDGSAEPVWLLRGTSNESSADISPNGRWLAYHSDESGRNEIYVRPFPNVDDNRWQISNRGGLHARWSRDGRELFFLEPGSPGRIIAVDVTLSNTDFSFGERHPIIDWPYVISFDRPYDVSLDGKQFLALKTVGNEGVTPKIIIVQNWFDELQQLVPTE
jgi:serine/threonine-protein kinase